jgi:redox-sensitive bicupin YhaK (pirin superfamily)
LQGPAWGGIITFPNAWFKRYTEAHVDSDSTAIPAGEGEGPVETVVVTRARELVEGFKVRRVLPSVRRRMVGPFIFLDQMGPELLRDGRGLDVAPHPHIGLATVTYLFEGELLHRDSLGTVQPIRPGEVNWMTAGGGIAHSERTPAEARSGAGSALFGIQSWVALPLQDEESAPDFAHHDAAELPVVEGEGKRVRLIAGSLYGARSPVQTLSEMFYADATLAPDSVLPLSSEHEERAVYVVEGSVEVPPERDVYVAGQLLLLRPGAEVSLRCASGTAARLMLLGGAPLEGKRHIWWNFVSSSPERIEQAKRDWREGRFAHVPGESERILLPETGPAVVRYP